MGPSAIPAGGGLLSAPLRVLYSARCMLGASLVLLRFPILIAALKGPRSLFYCGFSDGMPLSLKTFFAVKIAFKTFGKPVHGTHCINVSTILSGGRRDYLQSDVEWVKFIQRLKDTGMLLKDIQRYADLRYAGNGTMPERLELLRLHREYVLEQQSRWAEYLKNLDGKILFYQQAIQNRENQA